MNKTVGDVLNLLESLLEFAKAFLEHKTAGVSTNTVK